MDIQNTFSDIRNCFLDIQNNYFGYPKNGINVNSACHRSDALQAGSSALSSHLSTSSWLLRSPQLIILREMDHVRHSNCSNVMYASLLQKMITESTRQHI